jgi:glycosyltransferase involved in cell wall biosynthesis
VLPGSARVFAIANRQVDREALRSESAILHVTYYRDPRSLPARTPVVATVFDMAHEREPDRFARRWWSAPDPARHKRALCERADAIVCISEATRQDLLELLNVPVARTRVIHLAGTDWTSVPAVPLPGVQPPFFIWVGERHGYKNFLATLEAWAACPEAAGSTLVAVGGGALNVEECAAAERLRVASRVVQRDASDGQLRWAYEHAAGLLYTSLWEGFGIPVLEAMSLGCPVVASDRPALREVSGSRAILVEPTDREAVRDAIARCWAVGRGGACEGVTHAARFSWDACARAHEALYAELDR